MKVLMLSSDSGILQAGSPVQARMREYGALVERLDIIVCCPASELAGGGKIGGNVRVFPTRSRHKFFYVWDVLRTIKQQSIASVDLVTAQDPFEIGLAGWLASRRLRAKLQLQVHTDFLSPYFAKESIKNHIRVRLAKWLLPKANSVRVVSERIKHSLTAYGLRLTTVSVLPIFVDVQKIQSASIIVDLRQKYPQFNFILLTACRLTKEKNIAMAVKAMVEAVKAHPKAGLIIVGDGPEKKNLRLATRNLQLQNNVVFEPWIEDLPSYYKTADVFLNTSNYEGYGRTLMEAAAASLPIITTDVGLVGEILTGGDCLIVPVGEAAALAGALWQLAADKNLRQTLGRAAQKAALSLPAKEEYLTRLRQSWLASITA